MKKCCKETVKKLISAANSKEWQEITKKLITKYGKVLNLVEAKQAAEKEGKTLSVFLKELGIGELFKTTL